MPTQPEREEWFYITDAHGIILHSDGVPLESGYTDAALIGQNIYERVLLDAEADRPYSGGDLPYTDYVFIGRDGTSFSVRAILEPVRHHQSAAIIAMRCVNQIRQTHAQIA